MDNIPGVDLTSAKNAFDSFFKQGISTAELENNPAAKVLKQVSEHPASPNNIMKVDASKGETGTESQETMSVDQARDIIEKPKSFDELLKEFNIKNSELFEVVDEYLEKGYYEKSYKIKSLEFGLRSKNVYSVLDILNKLEEVKYVTETTAGQLSSIRNLASSLVYIKIGKNPVTVFKHETPEDDEKVFEFLKEKLHSPIYIILLRQLSKFDILVGMSTREEAINRFLALSTV